MKNDQGKQDERKVDLRLESIREKTPDQQTLEPNARNPRNLRTKRKNIKKTLRKGRIKLKKSEIKA